MDSNKSLHSTAQRKTSVALRHSQRNVSFLHTLWAMNRNDLGSLFFPDIGYYYYDQKGHYFSELGHFFIHPPHFFIDPTH